MAAGSPGAERSVGAAMDAYLDALLPWWRVIRADGALASRGREGAERQQKRLAREGVHLPIQER